MFHRAQRAFEARAPRAELGLYHLALHAQRVSFVHPTTGERVTFESLFAAGSVTRDPVHSGPLRSGCPPSTG